MSLETPLLLVCAILSGTIYRCLWFQKSPKELIFKDSCWDKIFLERKSYYLSFSPSQFLVYFGFACECDTYDWIGRLQSKKERNKSGILPF